MMETRQLNEAEGYDEGDNVSLPHVQVNSDGRSVVLL